MYLSTDFESDKVDSDYYESTLYGCIHIIPCAIMTKKINGESQRMETIERRYIEEDKIVSEINGEWQAVTKDNEGNAHIHTLTKHSVKTRPSPNNSNDIRELLVNVAAPATIKPLRRYPAKKTRERQTLVGGDAQFPFADPVALSLFLRAARELQPDEIVFTGDMVDFPALSKFQQRKEWVGSTQQGIDDYYQFLASLRTNAPNSAITVVHGNHEQRLINSLERNLSEVAGIRVALGDRALLSVQNLARYEELEVSAVDGYPNGTLWLEDNLKVVHGTNVKKGGFNSGKYLQEEHESTIFGHTHRLELAHRSVATRLGATTIAAASPGALCLTDGSVPGYNYTPTASGDVIKKAEDWQQGLLVVTRQGLHHTIEPSRFIDGSVRVEGTTYHAT